MARPLRIAFPGMIYDVSSRMLRSWQENQDRLFGDERDCEGVLQRLSEGVTNFGVRLYLFTLMSNHLVLETPQGNFSRFIQRLSTAYTVYFNKRHRRHGHLLDVGQPFGVIERLLDKKRSQGASGPNRKGKANS